MLAFSPTRQPDHDGLFLDAEGVAQTGRFAAAHPGALHARRLLRWPLGLGADLADPRVAKLLGRVHAGHLTAWDGSQARGRLSEDAEAAFADLAALLDAPGAPASEPGAPASEPGAPASEPDAPASEPGAPASEPDAPASEPGARKSKRTRTR